MQAPTTATRNSTTDPVLRVRGLRMRFGGPNASNTRGANAAVARNAVDGVDLDVFSGEILGLVGPNGAGKTTLMHLIAGLFPPDQGEIAIVGLRDPTRPIVRTNIGVATQAIALYGELTAEENLTFFARLAGVPNGTIPSRVDEVLAIAGLIARRRDRVRTLSGGMQRRLNLACAMVHQPRLLLLDEPTAGVDPQSRNHLLSSIGSLRSAGHAIVYATHHMEEAARVCDRVAIIDEGRIVAIDTIERLTARHDGDLERTLLALTGRAPRDG